MNVYHVVVDRETGLELKRWQYRAGDLAPGIGVPNVRLEGLLPEEEGRVYDVDRFSIGCFSSHGFERALEQCRKRIRKGESNGEII